MGNIYIRYIPLCGSVRGFTVEDYNGDYNIYINADLSPQATTEALEHELQHIKRNDFGKEASEIEELHSVPQADCE